MTFARPTHFLVLAAIWLIGFREARGGDEPKVKPAPNPAAAPGHADLATWEGFLWRSPEGWLRMGAPLVSEQFMAGAPQVVEAPLADQLAAIEGAVVASVKEPAFWFGDALKAERPERPEKIESAVINEISDLIGIIARADVILEATTATAEEKSQATQRRAESEPKLTDARKRLEAVRETLKGRRPPPPDEPRLLFKLRGRTAPTIVHLSEVQLSATDSPVSLRDAQLISVEVLDPDWLDAWRPIFTTKGSPWSGSKDGPTTNADVRKVFLTAAIDALVAMRAVPAKARDFASALAINPAVTPSLKFRHRIEGDLQRFIVAEAKDLRVELPTRLKLPLLPPTSDVRRWFFDARTRTEFLERAKLNWSGAPEDFEVMHYVSDGRGSTWQEHADLETIRNGWSDERYARIRATTLEILPAK